MDETTPAGPAPFCYCNSCLCPTRHQVLFSTTIDGSFEETEIGLIREYSTYTLLKCGGCDAVSLMCDEIGDHTNGDSVVSYFPPRSLRKRPDWLRRHRFRALFGKDAKYPLLNEIYTALDNEALRLAALGIRSLVEHVMIEQVGDQRTFKANLDAFESAGHVSAKQRAALDLVVEFGNAVTHRSHKPSRKQIVAALDVIETAMRSVYHDIAEVERHMKDLPTRPKK